MLTPLVVAWRESHPADDGVPIPDITTAQDGAAEMMYTMGGIMLGADLSSDAAVYLQLALYVRPDFPDATLALGDAYTDLKQYAWSDAAYEKIPAGNRLYFAAQLHIAGNEDRIGQPKEAMARLDRIIAQFPASAEPLIIKGDLLRTHERYAEAVEIYSQALGRLPKINSTHWPLLFARGACYDRLDKWDLAEKDLRQALVLKPEQPDVLNYLGYRLLELGKNIAEARTMIEVAVKARPDDAQIVDSMGWVLYLTGDYTGATDYLEKAVELLPGDATVNDHLGDVYWRLGRKTEARYQWERSLTFSPEAKVAGNIHKKLKDGLPPVAAAEIRPSASAEHTNTATP